MDLYIHHWYELQDVNGIRVVAPFVGIPFESVYVFPLTPYTYFGPTYPIIWPFLTLSPSLTIYLGDTWQ